MILGATAVVIAVVARDWDHHSTFEERELARARKRAETRCESTSTGFASGRPDR